MFFLNALAKILVLRGTQCSWPSGMHGVQSAPAQGPGMNLVCRGQLIAPAHIAQGNRLGQVLDDSTSPITYFTGDQSNTG